MSESNTTKENLINDSNGTTNTKRTSIDQIPDCSDVESKNYYIYDKDAPNSQRTCWNRFFGPIRAGSLRGSTMAMASITFGGGCLTFPYAVEQTGPAMALIVFAFVAFCSYYTLKILTQAGLRTKIMDYNQLLESVAGKKAVTFSDINNIILCIGVIMSYMISVYGFALSIGHEFFGIDADSKTNKLILMSFCFVFIQVPLSTLKNISTLQYASIVGTFTLIYSIIVIIIEMFFYLSDNIEKKVPITWVKPLNFNYLDTFSTFLFGFSSHNGILQVYYELKNHNTRRTRKVLVGSFIIELILYIGIAYAGYFSIINGVPQVFLNRPDILKHDYYIKIAKILLCICLHCTMAINFNIMRMSFKTMFFDNREIPFKYDFPIIIATYILANVVVFFVDKVSTILGIIGGVCTVVICFINPIIIHIKTNSKKLSHPSNLFGIFVMVSISILGMGATVKAIYDFIEELRKKATT
jgi:amino acid permease